MKNKVIIGTFPISGDLGFRDLKSVSETLSACISNGFYSFDTAPNYGSGFSENCLGKIKINSVDLTFYTKFGNSLDGQKNFSSEALISSLKGSLKRLRTDRVEAVFLHNPRGVEYHHHRHRELFASLKEKGWVKFSGLSPAKGEDYTLSEISWFDCIQDDFNLLYLSNAKKYFSRHLFFARTPLATGILSGKINNASAFNSDDYRQGWLAGARLESIMKRVRSIEALSDIHIKSLAIRYVLNNSRVNKMVIGVRSPKHVEELANDVEAPPLSDELIKAIESLEENNFGLEGEESLGF